MVKPGDYLRTDEPDECDEGCDCLEWDESDEEDESRVCGIHLFSGECDGNCGA